MRDDKTYYSVAIQADGSDWKWTVYRDAATEYARGAVASGWNVSEDEAKDAAREAAAKHAAADLRRKTEAATKYSYTIAV